MDQEKNTPEFHALPIQNFRFFNPATMQSLAKDLHLSLSAPALFHMQHVFRTKELRDPTVGELQLLNAFALLWHKMPGSASVSDIRGDEQQQRVMRDVLRKWNELFEQTPPTLPQMMDLLPRYLARSGIKPRTNALYTGTKQELAALSGGNAPRLSLTLGATAAMLMHAPIPDAERPIQGMLLLLSATEERTLEEEAERLFAAVPDAPILPLAAPMQEGILPHLLALGGVTLHTNAIPGYTERSLPCDLVSLGRNTLLLQAPEHVIPTLLATGAPLSLIGTTTPTGRLALIQGAKMQLSLPLFLLQELRAIRQSTPTLPNSERSAAPTPVFVQDEDTLLCGIEITADAEATLFSFFREAAARGADLSRATLSATLERALGTDIGPALALVLGYHRAAAELALPAMRHRQISNDIPRPRLCVYLTAPRTAERDMGEIRDWQALRDRICHK